MWVFRDHDAIRPRRRRPTPVSCSVARPEPCVRALCTGRCIVQQRSIDAFISRCGPRHHPNLGNHRSPAHSFAAGSAFRQPGHPLYHSSGASAKRSGGSVLHVDYEGCSSRDLRRLPKSPPPGRATRHPGAAHSPRIVLTQARREFTAPPTAQQGRDWSTGPLGQRSSGQAVSPERGLLPLGRTVRSACLIAGPTDTPAPTLRPRCIGFFVITHPHRVPR